MSQPVHGDRRNKTRLQISAEAYQATADVRDVPAGPGGCQHCSLAGQGAQCQQSALLDGLALGTQCHPSGPCQLVGST